MKFYLHFPSPPIYIYGMRQNDPGKIFLLWNIYDHYKLITNNCSMGLIHMINEKKKNNSKKF